MADSRWLALVSQAQGQLHACRYTQRPGMSAAVTGIRMLLHVCWPKLTSCLSACTTVDDPAGVPSASTCILDYECTPDQFCSSDVTASVCRCLGGVDGCDQFSTCQAKPAPPPPRPPPEVLTPCESCRRCVTAMQAFVAPLRTSTDASAQSAAFVSACMSSFMPGDLLGCRAIGDSITYSLDGNLAKRPGALYARLGNCSALLQSNSPCSITLPGLPMSSLSQCSIEVVGSGNFPVPPASGVLD